MWTSHLPHLLQRSLSGLWLPDVVVMAQGSKVDRLPPMIRIEDEFGVAWWVAKSDPAFDAVKTIQKVYYSWIVLPRGLIRQGGTITSFHTSPGRITKRVGGGTTRLPNAGWLDNMHNARYNEDERKRAIRLVECLKELI